MSGFIANVLLVGAGVALSGCGGGADPSPTPAPTPAEPGAPTCLFGGKTNDEPFHTSKAKAFIGLNPRLGTGSGFFKLQADFRADIWGTAPQTNGKPPKTRNDLCTCDCNGSPDGVGCTGWAGIAFRSLSLLRLDCKRNEWRGQMVANDCNAALGECNENSSWFEFFGEDVRESPGGAVVYSVATAPSTSGETLGGTFRQANSPVNCTAAKKDKADYEAGTKEGAASCFFRCGDQGQYSAWLAYCNAVTDTSAETGYSGWGV